MACSSERCYASSIEFGEGIRHVENAAPQSVDRPHHQDIELSPHRLLEHKCRMLGADPDLWLR